MWDRKKGIYYVWDIFELSIRYYTTKIINGKWFCHLKIYFVGFTGKTSELLYCDLLTIQSAQEWSKFWKGMSAHRAPSYRHTYAITAAIDDSLLSVTQN